MAFTVSAVLLGIGAIITAFLLPSRHRLAEIKAAAAASSPAPAPQPAAPAVPVTLASGASAWRPRS
jgi:hypothetical protein